MSKSAPNDCDRRVKRLQLAVGLATIAGLRLARFCRASWTKVSSGYQDDHFRHGCVRFIYSKDD